MTAYFTAIKKGADCVESDLVSTKGGVLVARRENEISATTDVSERPGLANRPMTRDD